VALTATYHNYKSTHQAPSFDYGRENDAQLSAKWRRYTLLLKYAMYKAAPSTPATVARETRKLWAQLEYLW